MPNQLATPFSGPQPWEAPDPLPVMRRELKLLLIEINVWRVEVQQLRAMEQEARKTEKFLSTSVKRVMESRDHWRREAERLHALIAQVPPWSLFWWHCVDAFKAWRKPTELALHRPASPAPNSLRRRGSPRPSRNLRRRSPKKPRSRRNPSDHPSGLRGSARAPARLGRPLRVGRPASDRYRSSPAAPH